MGGIRGLAGEIEMGSQRGEAVNSIRIGRGGMATLHNNAIAKNDLLTWAIYDHPPDFPDSYVVRPFSTKQGCPLTVHFQHAQLEHVRAALMNLGLTCLSRSESDPPYFLETWL
jgi:hypothetical protein